MIYVLDTDHLSILERGGANSRNLQVRLDRVNPEEIATTIVNYGEQMRGWLAWTATANTIPKLSHAYDRLHGHVRTFARITILPFDGAAADRLQRLYDARIKVGTMDRRIAAIALAANALLLTRNLADFQRIPGLHVEDWSL